MDSLLREAATLKRIRLVGWIQFSGNNNHHKFIIIITIISSRHYHFYHHHHHHHDDDDDDGSNGGNRRQPKPKHDHSLTCMLLCLWRITVKVVTLRGTTNSITRGKVWGC
ncbi:hypothetical protein M0804_012192 [Polistes exclamans]|nr:hypothetical protein M0804_012192 [Polistes exclamans]